MIHPIPSNETLAVDTENAADERKPQPQLCGFRAVYVFDRLSQRPLLAY
jgi:hypothetical protein